MASITINLDKPQKERLSRLALRYGLSLPEFSRQVLLELNGVFPSESLADYNEPQALKKSLQRALRDWQAGRNRPKL